MTATIDDIAKTLGEFEALAQSTGEWDGADPVEFSATGLDWLPVWIPTEAQPFPEFARATVHRKGVAAPTVIIVAWTESQPAADEWRLLWERKPMKLFGSFALRSAIRHAFRDVVGERRGPDEAQDGPQVAPTPRAEDEPDWDDMIAAAPTIVELDEIWAQMRRERVRTGAREVAYRARRAELRDAEWQPTGPAPELSEDELIRHHAFFGHPRPEPQDHLPGNRAERRAAARKKGRR